MIEFIDVVGKHYLNDDVKSWSFDKLEKVFKGKLDYVSLAKQLGISRIEVVASEESEEKPKKKTTPKAE